MLERFDAVARIVAQEGGGAMTDRNPAHEQALRVVDLYPKQHVLVIDAEGMILFGGSMCVMSVGETELLFDYVGVGVSIDLVELGIVPDTDGNWASIYCVPTSLKDEFELPPR